MTWNPLYEIFHLVEEIWFSYYILDLYFCYTFPPWLLTTLFFDCGPYLFFQLKKEAGKNCFKYYSLFFLLGKIAITKLLLQRNKMIYTMICSKLTFTSVLKKPKIFLRCWKTRDITIKNMATFPLQKANWESLLPYSSLKYFNQW